MKFLTKKKNFMFFVMLVFVFVSTSAMAITGQIPQIIPVLSNFEKKNFAEIPILKDGIGFPVFSAQAVFAYDLDSGIVLYEKNPDLKLLPASTTKIITALVALDTYSLDEYVKVDKFYVEGQKMGLVAGEVIKIEDLLYGMLVYSANDAAEVLARIYPEGREGFIIAMNTKAKEIGMDSSNFLNPVGLDGNTSSARDLVRASTVAMRNTNFAKIVGTKEVTIKSIDQKISHKIKNINELLGEVPGVLGVKTGWTENARENLVTYMDRDGHRIAISVLGSQDRFGETKELINWIFENYKWEKVDPYSP